MIIWDLRVPGAWPGDCSFQYQIITFSSGKFIQIKRWELIAARVYENNLERIVKTIIYSSSQHFQNMKSVKTNLKKEILKKEGARI